MNHDKITIKAEEALASAQQLAMAKGHTIITPLHLLHALLADKQGVATVILKKIGANTQGLGEMLESELNRLPTGSPDN